MYLSDYVLIREGIATTIAGTSTINGTEMNMAGYDGVLFIIKYGTAAANNTIKAQQDTATGMGSAADLEGTSVSLGGASDEIVVLDIFRPLEQFVRMVALRGTSTTIDWGLAIRYNATARKVTNALVGTLAIEQTTSPAEGTA